MTLSTYYVAYFSQVISNPLILFSVLPSANAVQSHDIGTKRVFCVVDIRGKN